MHKVIFFLLFSTLISGQVLASARCERKYNEAKEICSELKNQCTQAVICKDLRNKCPQSVANISGCETFTQCISENIPSFFENRCRYEWNGHPNQGYCSNTNSVTETVRLVCPGQGDSISQYADPSFTCTGQVKQFKDQKTACEQAVSEYSSQCAGDIQRPQIRVRECPKAELPLSEPEHVIVGTDDTHVDISRKLSSLTSAYKNRVNTESSQGQSSSINQ
ncbi:MAG: hypothetical protein CME63_08780 [Halobacteriovoraceae bacterium]|nr:hypothetical protein [Halobacteriovoraceae bacterium]MBC97831.1 hypothetical protein [Halobacteriovoraceae bacterium]